MTTINSKRELDAAVAEHVMGHVVTPRRDVFMSGGEGPIIGYVEARTDGGAWNLSRYSDNPAASYALEQRISKAGTWFMKGYGEAWYVSIDGPAVALASERHESRLIAMCIAALRALNVEFTLAEGWDKK